MQDIQSLMDREDAIGLAEHVKSGEVSRSELLEAAIHRLETVEPHLNAVAEKLYDQARRAPAIDGPFGGVPTLIKDLFSPLTEARMTCGSLTLGEARPGMDDEVVSRLRRAGCQFIGTTTSPEFGTSYTTESTRFGATRNPWDTARSTGGSSGGAAAVVSARVVPFAHGNDGGGSLRVPASCCGIFGLKPSRGRMPSGPLVGEGWAGMGTPHAMTLSVRDSAALLDVTAGSDLGAPYASPHQGVPFIDCIKRPPERLRIAMIDQLGPWSSGPEALAAVRHTAQLCESLGHHVEHTVLPVDPIPLLNGIFDIIGASTRSYLDMLGNMRGKPVTEEELEPRTRIILRERGAVSGSRYADAVAGIHTLGREMARFLCNYDLILSPTLTREPPLIGTLDAFDDRLDLATVIEHFHSYSPFTAIFNASGQPAMSVPLYWTEQHNLPIGSHFAGRFGEESTLLALAAQLEAAQPWRGRVPRTNALQR